MDFKSFAKGKGKTNQSKMNFDNVDKDFKKTVESTFKKSKGKSQEQLMSEILENASKQRKEGKLSNADLDKFYSSVAPMLSKDQVSKLKNIMNKIK